MPLASKERLLKNALSNYHNRNITIDELINVAALFPSYLIVPDNVINKASQEIELYARGELSLSALMIRLEILDTRDWIRRNTGREWVSDADICPGGTREPAGNLAL